MVRQAHHEVRALKTQDLILSLSKDKAKISCFFSILPGEAAILPNEAYRARQPRGRRLVYLASTRSL